MLARAPHRNRRPVPAAASALALSVVAVATLLGVSGPGSRPRIAAEEASHGAGGEGAVHYATFFALDYRRSLYLFSKARFVASRQLDAEFREFPGDIAFDGESFTLLANESYSGFLFELGADTVPDSEFSLFYGARIWKRHLQRREFPYLRTYRNVEGFDRDTFFGGATDAHLHSPLSLGQTYVLRLFHRTSREEAFVILRVLDFTPGMRATVQWRWLRNHA